MAERSDAFLLSNEMEAKQRNQWCVEMLNLLEREAKYLMSMVFSPHCSFSWN